MRRTGIITGLELEAEILRETARDLPAGSQPLIAVAGGDAGRAREAALAFAARGVVALASFGLAGGLDPALAPGDAVLASSVVSPDGETLACDPVLSERIRAGGLPVFGGIVAGSDRPVSDPAAKAALRAATGALVVDMESHGVARAARETGLPCVVLRVVIDPAGRAVPAAALAGMDGTGATRMAPVLAALARRPADLPGLLALRRDMKAARAASGRVALALLALSLDG